MNLRSQVSELPLADWPVAILAGGLATRLRPATETTPKALLEVAGEPFVGHQLQLLQSAGFRRIVLCVGYLGEKIETFVGDGRRFGLEISYSFDGQKLRGTGGALQQAAALLGRQFLVLYGDSYLPIDYSSVVTAFLASAKPALMAVFRNKDRWDTSNVSFEGGEIGSYSKTVRGPEMQYIDYGVAVLRAEVLEPFRKEERFELADVYTRLVEKGEMAGFEVSQRFYEIGSRAGWDELDRFLREQSPKIRS